MAATATQSRGSGRLPLPVVPAFPGPWSFFFTSNLTPALIPVPHSITPYPSPNLSPKMSPALAPTLFSGIPSPSHCSTPGPCPCLCPCLCPRGCSWGPAGPRPRPFGQQPCPLCQAPGQALGPSLIAASVSKSSQATGGVLRPAASCSHSCSVLGTGLPPCQCPHLLLQHLSATALTVLGLVPCPGAQALPPKPHL